MLFLLFTIIGKIIALITGVYYLNFLSKSYKLVLLHVLIVMACEIAGHYLSFGGENNSWVFNIFWILPELLFMGYAGILLVDNYLFKRVVLTLILIGVVIWCASIYLNGLNNFANFYFLYACLLLIVVYLNVLLKNVFSSNNILIQPDFWLSIS